MNRRNFLLCATSAIVLPQVAQSGVLTKLQTSSKAKLQLMLEAKKHLGLTENRSRDRQQLEAYINEQLNIDINIVETPWCAAFVDAVIKKCGYENRESLWARHFLEFGEPTKTPEFGDIAILRRGKINGHVGFFVKSNSPQTFTLLSGNYKSSVSFSHHHKRDLLGYRIVV